MARVKRAAFDGYYGSRQFTVCHPKYGTVLATAPDGDAAMVAAAKAWGTNWTRLEFYTACTVSAAQSRPE